MGEKFIGSVQIAGLSFFFSDAILTEKDRSEQDGSRTLDCHEDNLIQGLYSPGGLGDFLQKHPSSILGKGRC